MGQGCIIDAGTAHENLRTLFGVELLRMKQDFFKLGVQAARSGDYQKAQGYFAQAVRVNPNSEKGWLYLGHCLSETEKRVQCYQRVLKLNPSNQEAHKALLSLNRSNQPQEESDRGSIQRQPASASLPSASRAGQPHPARESTSKERSRKATLTFIGVGGSLVLCLVVIGAIFIGMGGAGGWGLFQVPADLPPLASAVPTASPALTILPIPTITQTAAPTQTPRPSMTPLATALPSATYMFDDPSLLEVVNTPEDGIPTQAASSAEPKTANDYYARALVTSSTRAVGSQDVYQQKMMEALNDINTAIALRSDSGNYYALRQRIYYTLGGLETYTVDSEAFYRLALADAYQANALGTAIEQYPDRIIIVDLIMSNQCDLALVETQKLMDATPKDSVHYGGFLSLQSRAYSCLGRLDDAIQAIRASMFNNQSIEYKEELESIYLMQAGRNDEALDAINKSLACCAFYGGYRYLWRASIYYSKGQKELARQDMLTGMTNTWMRGNFLAYMQAQFALDDGKKQEAIELLQLAEASFDAIFNPFRWKIQKQLASLGAKPISPTPSVSLGGTPSP